MSSRSKIVSTASGTHGRERFSRRSLLKALGAGAGMIPLLETDLVAGCLTTAPKRLLYVVWGNGVLEWPKGPEKDFTLPKFMEPLAPYRDDITFLDRDRVDFRLTKAHPDKGGADLEGHGTAGVQLTPWPYKKTGNLAYDAGGPSIDHFVGQELRAGGFTGRPNMVLGALHKWVSTTWSGPAQPNPPDNDPYHVFDTIFAGRMATGPNPAGDRIRKLDKSILDYVGRDLERLSRRVGKEDQQRVATHIQSVREIERHLDPKALGAGCTVPAVAKQESGAKYDVNSTVNFPWLVEIQTKLAVAALAADVSRSVVLQLGNNWGNHIIFSWLGYNFANKETGVGDQSGHHGIAHAGGAKKTAVDNWFCKQFAAIIGAVKSEKEAGGKSMLDNTGILVLNGFGNGASHSLGAPIFVAGGLGGKFRGGRLLTPASAVPHTQVLTSLVAAMGLPVEKFGGPLDRGTYIREFAGLAV